MLHNARDTMLVITVTGRERDGTGQGHELLFCRILTPFEHHQQQSVRVPKIKLTLTENKRPIDSFQ